MSQFCPQCFRHLALASDAQAEVITLREKIAALETKVRDEFERAGDNYLRATRAESKLERTEALNAEMLESLKTAETGIMSRDEVMRIRVIIAKAEKGKQ